MNHPEGLMTSENETTSPDKKAEGTSKKKSKNFAAKLISSELDTEKSPQKEKGIFDWLKSKGRKEEFFPIPDDLESPQPASEEEAPLEHLSDDEKSIIAALTHHERQFDEDNPSEYAEQSAIDDFYNRVISQNLEPVAAEQQVLNDFDLTSAEQSPVEEQAEEQIPSVPLSEFEDESTIWLNREQEKSQHVAEVPAMDLGNEAESHSTARPDQDVGFQPPPPNHPPTANSPGNFEPSHSERFDRYTPKQSEVPMVPRAAAERANTDALFTGFVVGGVIGYLIGRRRGRIKTEKRLLPIQKNLEKQVKDYQQKLTTSEFKIRKLVKDKMNEQGPKPVRPPRQEKLQPTQAAYTEARSEQPIKKTFYESYVNEARRDKAAEAKDLKESNPVPELLAKIVIANEAVVASEIHDRRRFPKNSGETKDKFSEEHVKAVANERVSALDIQPSKVQTLNRSELLAISQKIRVEGTNLRKVYETHLVGERGLRRLVSEYLRGGNIQKALRKEIVERQIDFEKDPFLRDLPSSDSGMGSSIKPPDQTLDGMIARATSSLNANSEAEIFYKPNTYDSNKPKESVLKSHRTDALIVGTIAFLIVVVVTLFLTGH
jgi:hypothetical protein